VVERCGKQDLVNLRFRPPRIEEVELRLKSSVYSNVFVVALTVGANLGRVF
jgi:hypothetical protein